MQKIAPILNHNRIYFVGLMIILFAAILFLMLKGNEAAFISLNSYHPFYLNVFFINYTFMGDGFFALCLVAAIIYYFKKRKLGFALLYSFLISGLAVQIIKNLVNSTASKLYFEAGTYLNFINDVTLGGHSGFPSGHTATAFAIATVLALMLKNKKLQLVILMAAVLVGYSRIYLAQHFFFGCYHWCIAGNCFRNIILLSCTKQDHYRKVNEEHLPAPFTITRYNSNCIKFISLQIFLQARLLLKLPAYFSGTGCTTCRSSSQFYAVF